MEVQWEQLTSSHFHRWLWACSPSLRSSSSQVRLSLSLLATPISRFVTFREGEALALMSSNAVSMAKVIEELPQVRRLLDLQKLAVAMVGLSLSLLPSFHIFKVLYRNLKDFKRVPLLSALKRPPLNPQRASSGRFRLRFTTYSGTLLSSKTKARFALLHLHI